MSDSPKYASVRLSAEVEGRLRQGRGRRAIIEQALRAAEEERRRQEQLAQAPTVRQRATEREKSLAALAEVGDRLAGLKADEVVLRWAAQEVKALEERMGAISGRIRAGRFALAQEEAAEILQQAERIVAQAQERQLQEERRQYIVSGLLQVLDRMGFMVQAGSPALEYPEISASATLLRAQRLGGGALAVSVPQEGEIWYDVDGFPRRVEAGRDGQPVKSCDEAQAQLEAIHATLEREFGIQMGELRWEGKDPSRIRKAAERLPDAAPTARRQRGDA